MTISQTHWRVLASVFLLCGALLLFFAISLLHQGEDQYLFGILVILIGWIAAVAAFVAAIFAWNWIKTAKHLSRIAVLCSLPITIVSVLPAVWCFFLSCSDEWPERFPFEPGGLLLIVPLAFGSFALARSMPQ